MPDQPNGTIARGASTFETDFFEFNGRAPTPEETRKHLAFDRLAKSSSLDPATLLLIVDAGRPGDDDDRAGQLGRIEALLRRNATRTIQPAVGPTRDLIVSAITVCLCVVVAVVAGAAVVPAVILISAFALGVVASLAYMYLAPILTRRR